MAGISIREFARRDGCSDTLVRRAIKQGKLKALPDGTLDETLVGSPWRQENRRAEPVRSANTAANSRANRPEAGKAAAPPSAAVRALAPAAAAFDFKSAQEFVEKILRGEFLEHGDAEAIKENGLALKHILAAMQASGDLVSMEVAQGVLFETHRAQCDVWLNFPVKVGPVIAAELGVEADRLIEALTVHVHQQCADLGEPDADFGGASGKP